MKNSEYLVDLCRKRDSRGQRELYERFKSKLMGICRRYTSRREEAQDVLQEAFVKIFLKFDQLESADKLEGWMSRICVTTAVNYYRKNRRFLFDNIEGADAANDDYEMILSNISDAYLIDVINNLPDGCRIIFNLYVVEGYAHAEISEMLGISESTSRSQVTYAKGILRQKLNAAGVLRYERYA